MKRTECYAVPGETIIDTIDSDSGLTDCYHKTLEDVKREYPGAERMTIIGFCEAKGSKQDSPIEWGEIEEDRFDYALEVLPPEAVYRQAHKPFGFMLGEPYDHHAVTGAPRCDAFAHVNGKYLASRRPITRAEFEFEMENLPYRL